MQAVDAVAPGQEILICKQQSQLVALRTSSQIYMPEPDVHLDVQLVLKKEMVSIISVCKIIEGVARGQTPLTNQ